MVVVDDDINVFNDGEVMWPSAPGLTPPVTSCHSRLVGAGRAPPHGMEYHEDGTRTPKMVSAMILDATKPRRGALSERARVPRKPSTRRT